MERVVHYKEIRIGHLVYGIWILLGGVLYNLGSTYVATTLRDGGVGTVEHACVRIYAYHGQSKLEIDLSHWYHEGIDLLFTIRTLNRVVDSKVSSWDPKLAADFMLRLLGTGSTPLAAGLFMTRKSWYNSVRTVNAETIIAQVERREIDLK
jgi:hypothetical protein